VTDGPSDGDCHDGDHRTGYKSIRWPPSGKVATIKMMMLRAQTARELERRQATRAEIAEHGVASPSETGVGEAPVPHSPASQLRTPVNAVHLSAIRMMLFPSVGYF
jgi:hypothetical protein